MCGRFETKASIQSIVDSLKQNNVDLELDPALMPELNKTVNIAPTNKILSVSYAAANYRLSLTNRE